jgi:hypothetical protein
MAAIVAARELGLERLGVSEPVLFPGNCLGKKTRRLRYSCTCLVRTAPAPIDKKSRQPPWLALHFNLTTTLQPTSPIPSSLSTILYPLLVRLEIDQSTLLCSLFKLWKVKSGCDHNLRASLAAWLDAQTESYELRPPRHYYTASSSMQT